MVCFVKLPQPASILLYNCKVSRLLKGATLEHVEESGENSVFIVTSALSSSYEHKLNAHAVLLCKIHLQHTVKQLIILHMGLHKKHTINQMQMQG